MLKAPPNLPRGEGQEDRSEFKVQSSRIKVSRIKHPVTSIKQKENDKRRKI